MLAMLLGLVALPLLVLGVLGLRAAWEDPGSNNFEKLLGSTPAVVSTALVLTLAGATSLVTGIGLFVRARWSRSAARGLFLAGLFLSGLWAMYFVAMIFTASSDFDRNVGLLWLSISAHVNIWMLFFVLRGPGMKAWFERDVTARAGAARGRG